MGYILTGKLGLMLALPPGYISGIFPAAGLAVAAAYLWGRPTLPWIFTGSFLLNLWVGLPLGSYLAAISAIAIALASTLQAWVGGRLLIRSLGKNGLFDTGSDVAGYLLLSPLICLVSSTLSVASLFALGMIDREHVLFGWLTWGLGDTLGLVTAFPIIVALFGRPAAVWAKRRWLIVATVSTSLALVVVAFIAFSRVETQKINEQFSFDASHFADLLQEHFDEQQYLLVALDRYLSLQEHQVLSPRAFEAYLQPSIRRFPMIQAIEWVPEVSDQNRRVFEAAQKSRLSQYGIRERSLSGKMVAATRRPSYFPVTYVVPLAGNEAAVGFDLASNPVRKAALMQALRGGEAVATEPIQLVQEKGSQTGVLLLKRVESGPNSPGVILTVVRMGDFVESALAGSRDMLVALTDIQLDNRIYGSLPDTRPDFEFNRILSFGGRQYKLQASPSPSFIDAHQSLQGWALLVAGTLATGFLGGLLLITTGATVRVQKLVDERTAALLKESAKSRALLHNASDGIHILDANGYVCEASDSFCSMLGYTRDEVIGMNVSQWDADLSQEALKNILRSQFESSTRALFETVHRRKDGSTFPVEVSGISLELEGQQVLFNSSRDISERKQTERELDGYRLHLEQMVSMRTADLEVAKEAAEEASRAKTVFLSIASHELRTPMNGVMGTIAMAIRKTQDPLLLDYLGKANRASKQLLAIINDVLDISRIESNRLTLAATVFTLREIRGHVLDALESIAKNKELTLLYEANEIEEGKYFVGDPTRLTQILINLVGNALKFTAAGQVTVTVAEVHCQSEGVTRLRFEIQDTGIGIRPEDQDRVFKPFEQAEAYMARKHGGTGLGLALCKKLTEAMSGSIGVKSQPGRGSLFWFEIEVENGSLDERLVFDVTVAETELTARYRGENILLVEDEPVSREIAQTMLEDIGLNVFTASDGLEAIECAKTRKISLILMDMNMPNMGGIEATRAIRLIPSHAGTPIIAMTANAFDEDRDACIQAGMNEHIGKPITPDVLFSAVLHGLDSRGLAPGIAETSRQRPRQAA